MQAVAEQLEQHIDGIRRTLAGELRPELIECGKSIRRGFDANFAAGGNVEGPWPPHAPSTVARYGVHPLLILSGDLHDAATSDSATGAVTALQDQQIDLSIDLGAIPYARVQNLGGGNIPQREFHVVGPDTVDACEAIIAAGLAERLGL